MTIEAVNRPVGPIDAVDTVDLPAGISPRKAAVGRFRGHRPAFVSVFVLAMLTVIALLAPLLARYGVNEPVLRPSEGANQFLSPRSIAWLGTDEIGRDLYSRLIYGLRVSLLIGVTSALISTLVGVFVGSVAGLRGGLLDDALMRVTDLFLAFPFLVALLVVRNMLGALDWFTTVVGPPTSIRFIVTLFALFGWMGVARLVRGQVLALREREFVEAARASGASNRRIVVRHLLPNSVGPIMVALTNSVVAAIIGEATLGFFGFGPDAGSGETSLGILVGGAKSAVNTGYWWLVVYPCASLAIVALCVSFVGDGLREATDPKSTR